ncbi:MAG: nucleoside-diphosphate sugar epimerase/dehydratase [bacterium]
MMPKHSERSRLWPERELLLLYLADLAMLQLSFLAAVVLYHYVNQTEASLLNTVAYFAGWPNLVVTVYWLVLLTVSRFLKALFPRTFYGELLRVFNTVSIGIVVMLFAMLDTADPSTFFSPSKIVIFTYWLALIITLSFNRILYYRLGRRAGDEPGTVASTRVVQKKLLLVVLDLLLITGAYYGAYLIRFEGDIPRSQLLSFKSSLPVLIIIRFSMFLYFRLYSGYYRYASVNDLLQILKAVTAGSIAVVVPALFVVKGVVPRAVFVIDWLLLVMMLGGSRFMMRSLRELFPSLWQTGRRTLIIGAGAAGEMLLRELKSKPLGYRPLGLIDDDPARQGLQLHGVPVLGTADDLPRLAHKHEISDAIIAIPSASGSQMRRLLDLCRQAQLEFKTIPSLREIIAGTAGVHHVRTLRVDDLLGRDPVRLDTQKIAQFLSGKRILVTGGGGSIGSEICRQVIPFAPARLTILDRAENRLYEIATELAEAGYGALVDPQVIDVCDTLKMDAFFRESRPDVIFHAAAYKQVPLMEQFPEEAIKVNVFGTRMLLELADRYQVPDFVFISTDKAVQPTSVMGASKRVAELLVQRCAAGSSGSYITVRFGNVLGSDGSVVPLFQRQIERGGPVTVTHPDVTRYFMTIKEASLLVMQAATIGHSGEIMVLNMGEPVKIIDLAKAMITLSGKVPEEDIAVSFTGLRPGEKLYEELFIDAEGLTSSAHEKILIARPANGDPAEFDRKLAELREAASKAERGEIRKLLQQLVPQYRNQASQTEAHRLGEIHAGSEIHPRKS